MMYYIDIHICDMCVVATVTPKINNTTNEMNEEFFYTSKPTKKTRCCYCCLKKYLKMNESSECKLEKGGVWREEGEVQISNKTTAIFFIFTFI